MRPGKQIGDNSKYRGGEAFDHRFSSSGALILNAGYEPLKVVNWQKAMILWLQDKVDVLEYHSVKVRSAKKSFQLPSVLRLRKYIRPHYSSVKVKLSRQNLFLRDQHTCLYCGDRFPEKVLTIDHIHPVSRGGKHEWTNVATACGPCNNKKGNMTPTEARMPLRKRAVQPKWLPNKEFSHKSAQKRPTSWDQYLSHLKK